MWGSSDRIGWVIARNPQLHLDAERRLWEHAGVMPTQRRVRLRTGEEIRVQEVGDGPPFVLIHGGAVTGSSWVNLAAALTDARCIMIDRPGCGLSDPFANDPLNSLELIARHADNLLPDVLDALELDHAAVGATSYGGYFAFRGAAAAPERVTKLVEYSWLIGAPSAGAPLTARLGSIPGLQSAMARLPMTRTMVKQALRQFGLGRAIDAGTFGDEALDWAHAVMRHTDTMKNEIASTPRLFTPIKGQNDEVLLSDELLATLTMPALFLWGADDPNGGEAAARTFVPRLPNAELVVLPGAEHAPWLDDLDTCVAHTRAFLLDEH